EEPPVVDLIRGDAPVRQPVGLQLEQLVKRIEARRFRRIAGEAAQRRINRLCDRGIRGTQRGQSPLVYLLLTVSLGDLLLRRLASLGGRAERALQILQRRAGDVREYAIEDPRVCARVEREAVLVEEDRE